jgi:hypothetical protein
MRVTGTWHRHLTVDKMESKDISRLLEAYILGE